MKQFKILCIEDIEGETYPMSQVPSVWDEASEMIFSSEEEAINFIDNNGSSDFEYIIVQFYKYKTCSK